MSIDALLAPARHLHLTEALPPRAADLPVDRVVLEIDARDALWCAEAWAAAGAGAIVVCPDPRSDLGHPDPVGALVAAVSGAGARLVGPASGGVWTPRAGGLAVTSTGGPTLPALLAAAEAAGLALREAIAVGMAADVGAHELISRWARDEAVTIIAAHGPVVGPPAPLVAALREAAAAKPTFVLGPDAEALAATGATPAPTDVAFAEAARLILPPQPPLSGPRIAVVANGEAVARWAAAALEERGLTLASPTPAAARAIAAQVHARAALRRIVDLLPIASARHVEVAARVLLEDAGVDGILVALGPLARGDLAALDSALRAAALAASKPVVRAAPEVAALALSASLRRRGGGDGGPVPRAPQRQARLLQALMMGAYLTRRQRLSPAEARRALAAYGVRLAPSVTVAGLPAARRAAAELGFPVHATVYAGEATASADGLADGDALEAALRALYDAAPQGDPTLAFEIRGARPGQALAVSLVAHPRRGHALTVQGAGSRPLSEPLPLDGAALSRLAAATAPHRRAGLAAQLAALGAMVGDAPEMVSVRLTLRADGGDGFEAVDASIAIADLRSLLDGVEGVAG
ncbi:MAG: hypothetical protein CSA66_06375 [Proteobacteria bacterium]|nr:MAG: hypothetical protein CSA66_06375 [Pseudomonadota bacterium]